MTPLATSPRWSKDGNDRNPKLPAQCSPTLWPCYASGSTGRSCHAIWRAGLAAWARGCWVALALENGDYGWSIGGFPSGGRLTHTCGRRAACAQGTIRVEVAVWAADYGHLPATPSTRPAGPLRSD